MHTLKAEHKQVLIKSYAKVTELEKALKAIHKINSDEISISVIGKLEHSQENKTKYFAPEKAELHKFFKSYMGTKTQLDSFYNPEIGQLFVVGFLVLTFLNPVGGRTVGALSGGPYGVLRGLGLSEQNAVLSIEKLSKGNYLLLARGESLKIEELETILTDLI